MMEINSTYVIYFMICLVSFAFTFFEGKWYYYFWMCWCGFFGVIEYLKFPTTKSIVIFIIQASCFIGFAHLYERKKKRGDL